WRVSAFEIFPGMILPPDVLDRLRLDQSSLILGRFLRDVKKNFRKSFVRRFAGAAFQHGWEPSGRERASRGRRRGSSPWDKPLREREPLHSILTKRDDQWLG